MPQIYGDFHKGEGISRFDQAGFDRLQNIDVHSVPGLAQCQRSLVLDNTTVTEPCYQAQDTNGVIYLFSATTGKVWKRTVNGVVTLEHTNSFGKHYNAKFFNNRIWFCTVGNVGYLDIATSTWNDSFNTFDNDAIYHPMAEVNAILHIGDGPDIASIDRNNLWNSSALDFPENYIASALLNDASALLAGTAVSTNVVSARVFVWDTYSSSWQIEDDVQAINFLLKVDNLTFAQAGSDGWMYSLSGGKLVRWKQMRYADNTIAGTTTTFQTVIDESLATPPQEGNLAGNATFSESNQYVQLTEAVNDQSGRLEYTGSLGSSFDVSFEHQTGGATGADGADAVYFYWGASSVPDHEEETIGGYLLAVDEFSSNMLQLWFDGTLLSQIDPGYTIDDAAWHTIRIVQESTTIKVYAGGTLKITYNDVTRQLGGNKYGWGARTGGYNNYHRIRSLFLQKIIDSSSARTSLVSVQATETFNDKAVFSIGPDIFSLHQVGPGYPFAIIHEYSADSDIQSLKTIGTTLYVSTQSGLFKTTDNELSDAVITTPVYEGEIKRIKVAYDDTNGCPITLETRVNTGNWVVETGFKNDTTNQEYTLDTGVSYAGRVKSGQARVTLGHVGPIGPKVKSITIE